MESKPTKLVFQELDHLQVLTSEEKTATQGGRSLYWNPRPRPKYPKYPDYPKRPDYPEPWPSPDPKPKEHPDPIYPVPCTNYPTKKGHLPWCAVIL